MQCSLWGRLPSKMADTLRLSSYRAAISSLLLKDAHFPWHVAALEAIAERGDRSLLAKIADSLDDDKEEVRFTGAPCIARLGVLADKHREPTSAVASAAAAS